MTWGARFETKKHVWNVHDCDSKHGAQRELVHWVSENFADGFIGWRTMLRFLVRLRRKPYGMTHRATPLSDSDHS